MPSGPNVDLGNDLVVQGLSASSLNAYLVPPTDVTQYKSIMLMIKNNAFVGTLTFQGADYDEATWNEVELFELSNTTQILSSTHTGANNLVYGISPLIYPMFNVQMTAYTSGEALATFILSRSEMPGLTLATTNVAITLDSRNKIGYTRNDGTNNMHVPAGTTGDTVVLAQPGMLARVLVLTTGTNSMKFFDNASAGSGQLLAFLPANPTADGTPLERKAWANNGITIKGDAGNPEVLVFFS